MCENAPTIVKATTLAPSHCYRAAVRALREMTGNRCLVIIVVGQSSEYSRRILRTAVLICFHQQITAVIMTVKPSRMFRARGNKSRFP